MTPEASSNQDREIVLSREIDAPRELVWKIWTDPSHIAQWWGPTGFTTKTDSMDVRPGGQWRYVMIGPDGREYKNLITYREVVEPSRLVYKHGGDAFLEPVNFEVTVRFEALSGPQPRTRVTMRSVFPSSKARDFVVREVNAIEGGKQHLGRLAEHAYALAHPVASAASGGSQPFIVRRVVNAPRELVFRVWTERDHLTRWFGPKGCSIPKCTLDLRPGGVFHYYMEFPNGGHWGKWVFREITAPEKLVFVVAFADEAGNDIPAPFFPVWPLHTLSTVTFEEHAGIGRGTVVTVRWSALDASEAEQKAFDANHASMEGGWNGTFEQLGEYLASPRALE